MIAASESCPLAFLLFPGAFLDYFLPGDAPNDAREGPPGLRIDLKTGHIFFGPDADARWQHPQKFWAEPHRDPRPGTQECGRGTIYLNATLPMSRSRLR